MRHKVHSAQHRSHILGERFVSERISISLFTHEDRAICITISMSKKSWRATLTNTNCSDELGRYIVSAKGKHDRLGRTALSGRGMQKSSIYEKRFISNIYRSEQLVNTTPTWMETDWVSRTHLP